MTAKETEVKENKLIKALIPKISEYFKNTEFLEKPKLA